MQEYMIYTHAPSDHFEQVVQVVERLSNLHVGVRFLDGEFRAVRTDDLVDATTLTENMLREFETRFAEFGFMHPDDCKGLRETWLNFEYDGSARMSYDGPISRAWPVIFALLGNSRQVA